MTAPGTRSNDGRGAGDEPAHGRPEEPTRGGTGRSAAGTPAEPTDGADAAPTRVVGAAILDSVEQPTRVLAAQRAYPPALSGLWEFPGGKQEPGESAQDALVRESREELDVDVVLLDEVTPPAPEGWPLAGTAVMRVFVAVVTDAPTMDDAAGDPEALVRVGEDHLAVRWLPLADPAQILGLPWIPADLPIVAALLEMLRTE